MLSMILGGVCILAKKSNSPPPGKTTCEGSWSAQSILSRSSTYCRTISSSPPPDNTAYLNGLRNKTYVTIKKYYMKNRNFILLPQFPPLNQAAPAPRFFSSGSSFFFLSGSGSGSKGPKTCGSLRLRLLTIC